MKIIQITDTHLMPHGTDLHGLNPCERLEACISSINEFHADADLCFITGDLTDQGHRKPITICVKFSSNSKCHIIL